MSRTQNILYLITAMAAGFLLASPVFAQQPKTEITVKFNATVVEVKGEVLVNQGEKYVPAQQGMRVKNGDRIMVMKGGGARIKYDNSCTETAETFSIYDVDSLAACGLIVPREQSYIALATNLLSNPEVIGGLAGLGIIYLDDDNQQPVSP